MSQQYGGLPPLTPLSPTPQSSLPPAGLSWTDTWIRALTRPSVETYEQIASDTPIGSNSKAYTWIFISSIIAAAIGVVASLIFPATLHLPSGPNAAAFQQFQSTGLLVSLICIPVIGLLTILFFAIGVGITQFVAGALGGTGNYSKLLYTSAAYSAPLRIVTAIIGAIPLLNCLNIIIGIYALVLDITVVKAVNQFSWAKAIAATLLIPILVVILVAVLFIVVLAALGPSIGNIFSNIVQTL